MNKFTWTPENLAYAVEQWAQGATSTLIAAAIGTTRNSVIGKLKRVGAVPAHRITLPVARATKAAEAPQNAPTVTPVTPKAPRRVRVSRPKTLLKLRFATEHRRADCRWPLGNWAFGKNLHNDPPATLFCGAPAEMGKSWCTAHCQQAFQRRR
jgi:hypothetical protein